jgi:hypothetical protein
MPNGKAHGACIKPLITLGMPPSWAFTLQVFWNAALVRPYPIKDRSSLFPIDFYYHNHNYFVWSFMFKNKNQ